MTELQPKIDAAQRALREAEQRLRALVTACRAAHRAEKVEVSAELRDAFAQLRDAQAELGALEGPPRARLHLAQEALASAEAELARTLDGLEVLPRAEKTWVSAAVQESFENLEAVKERLARVEAALSAGDPPPGEREQNTQDE